MIRAALDAHVHLYPAHDSGAFLKAAADGFAAAAVSAPGVLCFTETAWDDAFGALAENSAPAPGWRVEPTGEPEALRLVREADGAALIAVAGRQIVTREGLEAHAIGTLARFSDGESLDDALSAIRAAGAAPVIPWGFGKWRGGALRALEALLKGGDLSGLHFSDNSGRWTRAPEPALFAAAEDRGAMTLAGSDPLPFARGETTVARYGCIAELEGEAAAQWATHPATAVKLWLGGLARPPGIWGRRAGLAEVARDQVGMQIRKRLKRG